MKKLLNDLASAENGVVVFSSSTGRQFSIEDAKWRNGAFTKARIANIMLAPGFDGTYAQVGAGSVSAYAQPLFVDNGGVGDLVIVALEDNHVVAFDATSGKLAS